MEKNRFGTGEGFIKWVKYLTVNESMIMEA